MHKLTQNLATLAILGAIVLLTFTHNAAQAEDAKFKVVRAFPKIKFTRPLHIMHPNDGSDRLFVIEQAGRVLWFNNKADVENYYIALDYRKATGYIKNEEGLMGMAFHPNVKENGEVFLHYTAEKGMKNVLSRFKMNKARSIIIPKSEETLWTLNQPFWNHNGGDIAFGPDGYLYLASGDGGSRDDPKNAAQDKNKLFGKILRIDVDTKWAAQRYGIPKDNPFVGVPNTKPEIFCYGMRNPWRMSFDRKTGKLWVGDVGQDFWEEIHICEKGGNYGWPVMEGTHRHTKKNGQKANAAAGEKLIPPIFEYDHKQGKSITGGYVYRGKKLPALRGAYVYADYQTGIIWSLRYDEKAGKLSEGPTYLGNVKQITSFGEDRDGEIYVLSLDGQIYTFAKK